MNVDRLIARVTGWSLLALLLTSLAAGLVWGLPGAAGAGGAGGVALLNFRWLARGAARATAGVGTRSGLLGLGLRHLGTLAALGGLVATGWVHPVAVVVGVTVLPPVLIVQGLAGGDG